MGWKNPFVRLHILVFLWGFTSIIGKLITLDAFSLVFYRLLFASVILLLYLIWKKDSILISADLFMRNLLLGIMLALHWVMFFLAIKVSNVSIAISTLSTGALFTALMEPILLKKKIRFYEIFLSIVIIICMSWIFKAESSHSLGIIFGIGCSFLSALFSVWNANTHKIIQVRKAVFFQLFLGAMFVYLLNQILFHQGVMSPTSINDILWLLVLGSLLTAYPMIESFKLMKHVSPFTLLISINLETIYAILIAYLIWGEKEQMSLTFYICTFIMLAAIVIEGYLKSKANVRFD